MPIYDYACEKCEREFEVEQRITDAPLKSCPHCRSRRVKRLISQTSFVLKGGGWYSDLYASSKGEKPDKKEAEKPAASESGEKGAEKTGTQGTEKTGTKSGEKKKGKAAAA